MLRVQFGFVLPGGDARQAASFARLAEDHGWDAFFVFDTVWSLDPWVALAAAAMATERIKLGTMITPLPRRLPWDLASQTATLDHLSGGRVILSVGLGALVPAWQAFEKDEGRRVRAEKLDEGLEVLNGLWRGQPFEYHGTHYTLRPIPTDEPGPPAPPAPVQQPRIKTWVVGAWPRERSMRRAARYDGWLPNYLPTDGPPELTPTIIREAAQWLHKERGEGAGAYDVVVEGNTFRLDASAAQQAVQPWADAGANWWIEANWQVDGPLEAYVQERLTAGPPRLRAAATPDPSVSSAPTDGTA